MRLSRARGVLTATVRVAKASLETPAPQAAQKRAASEISPPQEAQWAIKR